MFDSATGNMYEGIGNYELTAFSNIDRVATMVCKNPYPTMFDEGLLTQITRKYKPFGSIEKVELDTSKESRKMGGDSCTYTITW